MDFQQWSLCFQMAAQGADAPLPDATGEPEEVAEEAAEAQAAEPALEGSH